MAFSTKFDWGKALYLALGLAVAFALYKFFGAEEELGKASAVLLLASALVYLASIAFWNAAWGVTAKIGFRDANVAGFSSLAGALTPFGLGSDVLRSVFANKAGRGISFLFASSVSVKIYKMVVAAVALLACFPFLFSSVDEKLQASLLASAVMLFAGVGALRLLSFGEFSFLKKRLPRKFADSVSSFWVSLRGFIRLPAAPVVFLVSLSLCLEFFSFYLLFFAFGAPIEWQPAFAAFLLLFFASKALVPQGFGAVEALGFFLLQGRFDNALVAGLLLAWDAVRAWIPAVLSVLFVFAQKFLQGLHGKIQR